MANGCNKLARRCFFLIPENVTSESSQSTSGIPRDGRQEMKPAGSSSEKNSDYKAPMADSM